MPDRLPRRTKLLYGVGDIGFSLTATIIGAFFAIFLTDVVGLSPGAAGAAIFVGSTWDYVNDPIMGYISDHQERPRRARILEYGGQRATPCRDGPARLGQGVPLV